MRKNKNSLKKYIGLTGLFCFICVMDLHAQDSSYVKKAYRRYYNRYWRDDLSKMKFNRTFFKKLYYKYYNQYWRVDSSTMDRDSALFLYDTLKKQNKPPAGPVNRHKDVAPQYTSKEVPAPVVGYSQENRLAFGVALIYAFYRNQFDVSALSSSFYFSASFKHLYQIRYRFKPIIFGTSRQYRVLNELAFLDIPFNFYGIGNHTRDTSVNPMLYVSFYARSELQKRVARNLYVGTFLQYQYIDIHDFTQKGIFSRTAVEGKKGGDFYSTGFTATYDSRNFLNYANKGNYYRAVLSYSPAGLHPSQGNLLSFTLEDKNFITLSSKAVLAFNANYYTNFGRNIPFTAQNLLGNGSLMRGYYAGRFRDNNLLAGQAEYRVRLMPRFGVSVFAGTGLVYGHDRFAFSNLKPDIGGGIRYIFDLKSRSTIRMDYGVGEKHPGERRIQGFYFSLNEAF